MPTPVCGPFLLALLLGACGQSTKPSAAEDERLDNAAELLDSAPDRLTAVDDDLPGQPQAGTPPAANSD